MRPILASFVIVLIGFVTCYDIRSRRDFLDCIPGDIRPTSLCRECIEPGIWRCSFHDYQNRNKRDVPVPSDLRSTPCSPNDFFVIECNRCYCNNDRTGYLCTENLCPLAPNENGGGAGGGGNAKTGQTPTRDDVRNFTRETTEEIPLNGVGDYHRRN